MKWTNLLCAAIVLACSAASAAFKLEPIPEGMVLDHMQVYCVASEKESPFEKEPTYTGEPQYGRTYIWGKQLMFVAFSSSGDVKDTIIIDLNQNGDVTDDARIGTSKPVALSIPGGKPVNLVMNKADAKRPGMYTLRHAEWYRGQVKLGDKTFEAALMDMGMNGLAQDGQDLMLVDLDGDGVFKFDMQSYQMEGVAPLGKRAALNGDVWNVNLDTETPDVTLTAFEGDCGRLETCLDAGIPPETCSVMGFVASKDMPYILTSNAGAAASRIPVGTFENSFFTITTLKDGKAVSQLQYRGSEPITIEKGKTCTVTLGKPGKMKVDVSEKQGKLSVSHTLLAGKGATLSSVMAVNDKGKLSRPPAPKVEVRSTKADERVASGNMEYG